MSSVELSGQQSPKVAEDCFVAILTGTHSSGKSTLLSDLEMGKLSDLSIYDGEFDDLGYGVMQSTSGDAVAYVTLPEAARWWAGVYDQPDRLAQNYSLDFQLEIDAQVVFRMHTAMDMAAVLLGDLQSDESLLDRPIGSTPIVISDRGPLDGIVYSALQLPGRDIDVIDGSPRTGFAVEWLKSYVGAAYICDHSEVPFESDTARLSDVAFRDAAAAAITSNYEAYLGHDQVTSLVGSREDRKTQLIDDIVKRISEPNHQPIPTPYTRWADIRLIE